MAHNIKKSVLNLIQEKYEIVDVIDLVKYSSEAELLAECLSKYYNVSFGPTQRLVVLHHDTDYYASGSTVGNLIYNFLRLCSNFMISTEKIIFLTNHYGIKHEISETATQHCNIVPPQVIYTSQWFDFPDIKELNIPESDIIPSRLYCCLNQKQRRHRVLTLCMLKEFGLLDQGVVSYHFGN